MQSAWSRTGAEAIVRCEAHCCISLCTSPDSLVNAVVMDAILTFQLWNSRRVRPGQHGGCICCANELFIRRMCAANTGAPGSSWRHATFRFCSVSWCLRTCRCTWTQASMRFMRARRPSQTASTRSSSCTTCFLMCPQTLPSPLCPRNYLSSYLLRWTTQPSHTRCSTQGCALTHACAAQTALRLLACLIARA